jgi:type VI secretion system protein VasJ
MLGSLRLKDRNEWQWAAYGKHPALKDYITAGQRFPLMKVFSEWVENGYEMAGSRRQPPDRVVSWRLWARGLGGGNLLCGIVKDNSDSLGRPYPLLILGTGALENWEDNWDLMPLACERAWNDMEYLSTHIYADLNKLEVDLKNVRRPVQDWSALAEEKANLSGFRDGTDISSDSSTVMQSVDEPISTSGDREECLVPINELLQDQFGFVTSCHTSCKTHSRIVPNFAFIGGTFKRSYLLFLRRPVKPGDFADMWSDFSRDGG